MVNDRKRKEEMAKVSTETIFMRHVITWVFLWFVIGLVFLTKSFMAVLFSVLFLVIWWDVEILNRERKESKEEEKEEAVPEIRDYMNQETKTMRWIFLWWILYGFLPSYDSKNEMWNIEVFPESVPVIVTTLCIVLFCFIELVEKIVGNKDVERSFKYIACRNICFVVCLLIWAVPSTDNVWMTSGTWLSLFKLVLFYTNGVFEIQIRRMWRLLSAADKSISGIYRRVPNEREFFHIQYAWVLWATGWLFLFSIVQISYNIYKYMTVLHRYQNLNGKKHEEEPTEAHSQDYSDVESGSMYASPDTHTKQPDEIKMYNTHDMDRGAPIKEEFNRADRHNNGNVHVNSIVENANNVRKDARTIMSIITPPGSKRPKRIQRIKIKKKHT